MGREVSATTLLFSPQKKKLGTHFAGGFECLAARMDGPKGLENRS
jgi:hypothetical protein